MVERTNTPPRSALRIADLKSRVRTATKLMNVKIPVPLGNQIDRLAKDLNISKTEVVLALLNAGLDAAAHIPGLSKAKH